MKKILSLMLALVVVMGLATIAVSAVPAGSSHIDFDLGADVEIYDDAAGFGTFAALGSGAATYIIKAPQSFKYTDDKGVVSVITLHNGVKDKNGVYGKFVFTGNKTLENLSWNVSHITQDLGAGGMPKGINGEELLTFRTVYDTTNKEYALIITPVANPTVEYFSDVTITVKLVIANVYGELAGKTTKLNLSSTKVITPFDLANLRYTAKDAWKDANGIYRISAADRRPVVEAGVFAKAYGRKLIIDYPSYRVIFPTVKNQDIALNLWADVVAKSTIALKADEPILTARFHDIYVKDKVQIEFKVNADAQNYKGVTLYAYELNADNKPVKAKEVKVVVSDSATIVVEIPANTKLASIGSDVKLGAFGIYGTPQEGVKDTTTTDKDKNPAAGPSDSVSVATAFAVISLAAAGFVAVGKAGKK